MGTKNDPGAFDCYASADPDEPMFVLLGRDPTAGALVRTWVAMRRVSGEDPEKLREATACADALDAWAAKLGKLPAAGRPVLRAETVPFALQLIADACAVLDPHVLTEEECASECPPGLPVLVRRAAEKLLHQQFRRLVQVADGERVLPVYYGYPSAPAGHRWETDEEFAARTKVTRAR